MGPELESHYSGLSFKLSEATKLHVKSGLNVPCFPCSHLAISWSETLGDKNGNSFRTTVWKNGSVTQACEDAQPLLTYVL